MIDLDIALYKLNPSFYYRHNGIYDSLEMLDNSLKPSLLELHDSYNAWLNNEAKAIALAKLEQLAEIERLKYVTQGDGKAMAYQQQLYEVRLWQQGTYDINQLIVANTQAIKLNVSIETVLSNWQQNINAWLYIGSKIEANLAKAKVDLANLNVVNQSDLDNFLNGINWLS
jgi:hypothetical protein